MTDISNPTRSVARPHRERKTTARQRLSGPRRTQAQRRDESQRLLVEATLKIVAEQGVSAATFEEIGEGAGFSRGLVTQHFGSKRGLIEAVIEHLHRKREATLQSDQIDRMRGVDAVMHYIASGMRSQTEELDGRAYFMLLASTVADATAQRDLFAASHQRVREQLYDLLEQSQRNGQLRQDVDCDATALMVGCLLLGASVQRLVDPATDLAPIASTAIKLLKHALGPIPTQQKKRIQERRSGSRGP